ncbi:MAG: alkaline phosphatase family protein [Bacteroidales bacterium]|nr:alkaline phosphatase family protein [Bacteroidales bacterium]
MKRFLFAMALAAMLCFSCKKNDGERYVLILSMDGFRYDLPQLYNTPTLDSVASVGVYSEMKPSYPSMTLPNHYTMATGLYPDHHGIVMNNFYDSALDTVFAVGRYETRSNAELYHGEPIWNTVQRQGLSCNVFDWIGIEAPIGGSYPDYYIIYDPARTRRQMADMVLEVLCREDVSKIPNLVMWYIDQPDAIEHSYSAESEQTREVVEDIDSVLRYFLAEVRRSPVYDKIDFIFTADHGHTDLSPDRYLNLYPSLGELVERSDNQTPLGIVPREGCTQAIMDTLAVYAPGRYRYWLRDSLPEEYHYGTFTTRIPDIIIQPDLGWKIFYHPNPNYKMPLPGASAHGYDPEEQDMHMVFYAFGPHFKKGYKHDRVFCNVNDYLILCRLLNVEPAPNDGNIDDIKGLFFDNRQK